MSGTLPVWRIVLVASAVLMIVGTVLYAAKQELQSLGFGIFLAAMALFVIARVMIYRRSRVR